MKFRTAILLAALLLALGSTARAQQTTGRYVSGLPTAVTSGTVAPLLTDQYGRLRIVIDSGVGGLALESGGNLAQLATDFGAPGATACATDTSSCNFNQLMQRLAQRLTTINTTLGSLSVLQGTSPWIVSFGPSASANAGLAPVSSTALEASHVIKASAGNLYSFEVAADSTLSAAAWWIMVYNATAAPADGAVTPVKCYPMPAGATGFTAAWPTPVYLSTGITIGVSTTGCLTKTASSHAFISGDAQ